jgi:hypothetical protein
MKMNTKRNSIEWGLAFAALGFLDATMLRFFSAGLERVVWLTLASVCLAFVAIAIRRTVRMALCVEALREVQG